MEFSYTNTPPQHRAGFLTIAHSIRKDMVIPPNAENYTISTICTGSCTQAVSNGRQSPVFMLMKSEWSTYRLVFACLFVDCRCSHQRELLPLVACFTHTSLVRNSQSQCNFTIVQYNIIMHLYRLYSNITHDPI